MSQLPHGHFDRFGCISAIRRAIETSDDPAFRGSLVRFFAGTGQHADAHSRAISEDRLENLPPLKLQKMAVYCEDLSGPEMTLAECLDCD